MSETLTEIYDRKVAAGELRPDAAQRNLAPGFPIRIPASPPTPSP